MRRSTVIFVLVLWSLPAVCAAHSSPWEKGLDSITVERSQLYVETLAGDRFEGRKAGTRGLRAASKQIVRWLEEAGAVPFEGRSYFQKFREPRIPEVQAAYKYSGGIGIRNILAKIEGVNPDEYVFVGAHYDHMGMVPGGPDDDRVFNGADDNASGVAGVLQIARAFAASGEKPQRTVVFALWDAEEAGLVGSTRFGNTFDDMNGVRAYFNFDMIGRDERGSGGQMLFFSNDSIPYSRLAKEDIAAYGLGIDPVTEPEALVRYFRPIISVVENDGRKNVILPGNSDYLSFMSAGVPVYMISTGLHSDYHRPGDEADKIDYQKMTDISKLSFLAAYRLANPGVEINHD